MESRYKETHQTWDKIAQLYEDKFMDIDLYNDTYKRFCDLIARPEACVLEIGCGPGNITRHILNLKPRFKILATDISKNMVELAKRNNPDVEIQVLDCRNLSSINRKFDGIICGFTIPYLSKNDSSKMIADCSQLLKEEGVLYLSFVSDDYEKSGFISGSTGDRTYFYYHELESIKKGLELNQMEVIDIIQKKFKKSGGELEMHTIINAKLR